MKTPTRPPSVLLVEPQFVMRRTMVTVARELNVVDFHEATSVARALPLLATRTYSGLVLDMGDDGAEAIALLERLRAGTLASRADMPVIALAFASAPELVTGLDGFQPLHTLHKPFKVGQLLESVSRMGLR